MIFPIVVGEEGDLPSGWGGRVIYLVVGGG